MNRKEYSATYRLKNKEKARENSRAYRARNKDKVQEYNKTRIRLGTWRLRLYGVTAEEFDSKMKDQKGLCAVCSSPLLKPQQDHCHKTKKARGVLCWSCNLLLGNAKDSIVVLQRAIDYLKRYGVSNEEASQL